MTFRLFILVVFLLVACNEKEIIEYHEDGSIRLECDIRNDMRHGQCIEYYENGFIKSVSEYKNDTLNGESIFYRPNGVIYWQVDFDNGEKNGEITYFDSLGRKFQTSTFKNSKLHGKTYSYYPDGKLESEMSYNEGELDGAYKSLYENGKIHTWATFVNGEKVDFETYDSLGVKIDHFIKYDISHEFINDKVLIVIEIVNPLYDVAGLRIFKYDYENDSIQGVSDQLVKEGHRIEYQIERPKNQNKVVFKGLLLEIESTTGESSSHRGGGVVRSSREIEYVIEAEPVV